jgi:hypothetical protein
MKGKRSPIVMCQASLIRIHIKINEDKKSGRIVSNKKEYMPNIKKEYKCMPARTQSNNTTAE